MVSEDAPGGAASDSGDRRRFLINSTVAVGTAYAAMTAYPFLDSLAPSERAKAEGGPVEANIGKLAPGELMTVAWRSKPVWILRRTPEMLAGLKTHDQLLTDPSSLHSEQPSNCINIDRSQRPEWFVCVGVCTHLGCSPTLRTDAAAKTDLGASWPGGFFCPCHGSKFDLAGRVFKGVPAPINLVIPNYRFLSDTRLQIGEETST
jgi:ubiquinol-cytochrome c reductase iron-sulfur subunit